MTFAYIREFPLPRGYAVEFSLENGRLEARWSPDVPQGQRARKLMPAYRAARDEFLASLSVPTMVIEI